jgi:hypothetical protein
MNWKLLFLLLGPVSPNIFVILLFFTVLLELAGGPMPPALIGDRARVLCSDSCFYRAFLFDLCYFDAT